MAQFFDRIGDELSLVVRQQAWLSGRPKQNEHDKDPRSRRDIQIANGLPADPPPTEYGFIIEDLYEVGPAEAAGMGQAPISWGELGEWQRQTGRRLPPWRIQLLRRLSRDFVDETYHGTDFHRPAPWRPKPTEAQLRTSEEVRKAMLNAFR